MVIKDHKECLVQEETEGTKDPLGKVDPEDLRECTESEALREIKEEKETKERKEKASKQVKQV